MDQTDNLATAAKRAVETIEAMVRTRCPQATIAWEKGKYGLELKVGGAKFPRVGRIFVLELTADVATVRHKWPGLGEFRFGSLKDWIDHVERKNL